jgi:hypothetical protein
VYPKSIPARIQRLEREARAKVRAALKKTDRVDHPWTLEATRDTFTWVTRHTKTYNEHWREEGRPSPLEPFPEHEYFVHVFDVMDLERIVFFEKSRDMMLSWACVAYLTRHAMTTSCCGILFQTQKHDKVIQLVNYAKHLWRHSGPRIREAFPLSRPLERQSDYELEFANGSSIFGIPGGANQIRSYHPWGYLNDESSFQPDAGECYNEALSAIKGKIIFNSSAGPGWYADVRKDIIREKD